jgi:tRNA-Thr(GGU) m(6)t(6)A37 methyltransferase TsaA
MKSHNVTQMKIKYQPIGVIHSPFKDTANMPIQPSGAVGIRGRVEVFPKFAAGLKDLEGFSHVMLICHFHRAIESQLVVIPFLDSQTHGVFATRAPSRPNPIGLSIVKLLRIRQNMLEIDQIDLLDGTPVLDIKPYVPEFDQPSATRFGWLQHVAGKVRSQKSDNRFHRGSRRKPRAAQRKVKPTTNTSEETKS